MSDTDAQTISQKGYTHNTHYTHSIEDENNSPKQNVLHDRRVPINLYLPRELFEEFETALRAAYYPKEAKSPSQMFTEFMQDFVKNQRSKSKCERSEESGDEGLMQRLYSSDEDSSRKELAETSALVQKADKPKAVRKNIFEETLEDLRTGKVTVKELKVETYLRACEAHPDDLGSKELKAFLESIQYPKVKTTDLPVSQTRGLRGRDRDDKKNVSAT